MKVPPFIIGAAAVFWGVETDRMIIGVILFLLFEARALVKTRYDFDEDDFVKISDLTSLVFLGTVALVLLNYEPLGFLRITVGWLPAILFPLIMAQLYSKGDTVTIGTRLGKKEKNYAHKPFDFRIYYVVICVFAAATGNSGSSLFLPGVSLIFTAIFFVNRGMAYHWAVLPAFLVVAASSAYGVSSFMERSHRYVANQAIHYFYSYYRDKYGDPYWTNVKFGDTGRLKSSGKIVMRVDSASPPQLLKAASYNEYSAGSWLGDRKGYTHLPPRDEENWDLLKPPHDEGEEVRVEFGLPKEKGLLPAPLGSYALNSTTISEISQNINSSMRVTEGASLVTYSIDYDIDRNKESDIPQTQHYAVPKSEKYVLDRIKAELDADGDDPDGIVASVADFFAQGFTYSLSLAGAGEHATPLGNFLLKKKSGFCEYYATATVLLLRHMGVPSRYAVGYAVTEKSLLEGKYIVRQRHAHAWAEAFVDGRWTVVDTTPANWAEKDGEKADFLEPVKDFFNFLNHRYKLYQVGGGADYTLQFSIAVVVLTAFLVIRIYRRMKMEQAEKDLEVVLERTFSRVTTPLTPVIDFLEETSEKLRDDEHYTEWAERSFAWRDFDATEFGYLYRLHLKKRFDPDGLDETGDEDLALGAEKYRHDIKRVQSESV